MVEVGRGGTEQARWEREMIEGNIAQRLAQLQLGDASLVFGRIDRTQSEGGDSFYIGRLAVADEERNGLEGFHVAREGLTYVHIPVVWTDPRTEDVRKFFDSMQAHRDRKVFVHCFANMRASVFVYLYRALVEGVPEEEARATLHEVWDPADRPERAALIERVRAEHAGGGA